MSGSGKQESSPNLEAAYAVESPEDNRKLYAEWADTYESEFVAESQYIYHRNVAEIFAGGFDDLDSPVLDVGCGTGIVGQALRGLGVTTIDGIDISPEMLAAAGTKTDDAGAVYRDLIEADLTATIAIDDHRYSGVVSAGAFTHGHLGPDSLHELLRVAKPGARFALGINAAFFAEHGFAEWFEQRVGEGTIGSFEAVDTTIYGDADENDLDQLSRVAVFELLAGQ